MPFKEGQTVLEGEYVILRKLGEGAFGIVYKAESTGNGQTVAVKELKPGYLEDEAPRLRLIRELEVLRDLDHPGVVRVISLRLEGPRYFLVMEFMEGGSLAERIQDEERLSVSEAVQHAVGIADTLAVVHRSGVVHRDIKPENLLLTGDGELKISDFGLCLMERDRRITESGELVGTIEYMPPEQLKGESVDQTADIYALGATLYYMLTGRTYLPFRGNVATDSQLVLESTSSIEPPGTVVADIPKELDRIVLKCLERNPEARYKTADGLKRALAHLTSVAQPTRSRLVAERSREQLPDVRDEEGYPSRHKVISTGSLLLDMATGIGGVPKGLFTEIYGPPGGGKTILALHVVAHAQSVGGRVVYLDVDRGLDLEYAAKIGVNPDRVHIIHPYCTEEAFQVMILEARTGLIDLIVLDSLGSLSPRVEMDELQIEAASPVLQEQLIRRGLRLLVHPISSSATAVVLTNQLEFRHGVLFGNPYSPLRETEPLAYFASLRMEVRRVQSVKSGTEVTGNVIKVHIKKNRLAAPFRTADLTVIFGEGIRRETELLELGAELGLVDRVGSKYCYRGTTLGSGLLNAAEWLKQHRTTAHVMEKEIRRSVGL